MRANQIFEGDETRTRARSLMAAATRFARSVGVRIHFKYPAFLAPEIEITDLYANVPGSGAGTKLMTSLCTKADEEGFNLYAKPEQERNQGFYARFGFEKSPRHFGMLVRYCRYDDEDLDESTKLTELSMPTTRDKAEWILLNAGYKQLGRGHAGAVFQKHGNKGVVKLYDARDKAFTDFIALATANPNPHFPSFGKPVKVTDDFYAVRTELLQPTSGRLEEIDIIDKFIRDMRDYGQVYGEVYQYMANNPGMREACMLIVGVLKQHYPGYMCDVYSDNVMTRGSTLVLSDPISVVQ